MNHKFECMDALKYCASEVEKKNKKLRRKPCVVVVQENGMGTATPRFCPYLMGTKSRRTLKILFREL